MVSPSSTALQHLELNAPLLDNALTALIDDQSTYNPPLLDAISRCPRLTSLYVKDWRPIVSFHKDCLPPTLFDLEIYNSSRESFSLDIFISSVSRCTALACLTLRMLNILEFVDRRVRDRHPIILPNVVTLELYSATHNVCASLLKSFEFPHLYSIRVYINNDDSDHGAFSSAFIELVRQCGHSLHNLIMSYYERPFTSPELLREMVQGLLALTSLEFYETLSSTDTENLLGTLRCQPDGQLLPRQNVVLDFFHIDAAVCELERLTDAERAESHKEDIRFFCDFLWAITELVHSRSSHLFSVPNSRMVHHFSQLSLGPNLWRFWSLFTEEMRELAESERWDDHGSMTRILHDTEVNEKGVALIRISM